MPELSDRSAPRHPWVALPPMVSDVVRSHMASIGDAIIHAIQAEVPDYARPLEGDFGTSVRQGVQVALGRLLLELPGKDAPALTDQTRSVYAGLGKGEARTGRPMAALLAAYRTGARVAFRVISQLVLDAGLDAQVLLPLGESIFQYIDELSASSLEAFTAEQSRQAGERDRRRAELLELMVGGRTEDADLRTLAAAAGWTIPLEVLAVVVPRQHSDGVRLALGERALVRSRDEAVVALLPTPASARGRVVLERSLAGRHAWIGPSRPWRRAGGSMRAALAAMTMPDPAAVRTIEGEGPWWVSDHLASLVLGSEPELIAELAALRLAPLRELRPRQQERLTETLLAWLGLQGDRGRIAAHLHLHPQTVGYRVAQLREVFGADLDDPVTRFELELVLRAGHA
ncbi:PucR family transcriptional regulator [Dermacoccaceae bacterium W4C1]